jgi:hypothetical protein
MIAHHNLYLSLSSSFRRPGRWTLGMIKHGKSTICLLYLAPAGIRAYVEHFVVIWAGIIFGASGTFFVGLVSLSVAFLVLASFFFVLFESSVRATPIRASARIIGFSTRILPK